MYFKSNLKIQSTHKMFGVSHNFLSLKYTKFTKLQVIPVLKC